jgi:hypothetical protein
MNQLLETTYRERKEKSMAISNMFNLQAQTIMKEDAFAGMNLGGETLLFKMPISRFIEVSQVANERNVGTEDYAQRELDKAHAAKLAVYLLKALVATAYKLYSSKKPAKDLQAYLDIIAIFGAQPYQALQPIVANLRDYDLSRFDDPTLYHLNQLGDKICVRVPFTVGDILYIVDGQHRRHAMTLVLEFLRYIKTTGEYPKKGSLFSAEEKTVSPAQLQVWHDCLQVALTTCTVAIECHINLDPKQERQLFHDLNNLGKKVSASLAFEFDEANPVNRFIKEALKEDILRDWEIVEKDIVDWEQSQGEFPRKDLIAINAILIRNKTNVNGATPGEVDAMRTTAESFWRAVAEITHLGQPGAKIKTVAAQPVVLKALAKLAYDFAEGKSRNPAELDRLLDEIPKFDFSHENKLWRYYITPEGDREKEYPGLRDYLPPGDGNRDIGSIDSKGRMRFGAKHNDIYPILGDMIRWRLKLPSRHAQASLL